MDKEQALKFMHDLLRLMLNKKASDLFITAGYPPAMKIDGKMTPVSQQQLTAQHTAELVRSIMNEKQAGEFEAALLRLRELWRHARKPVPRHQRKAPEEHAKRFGCRPPGPGENENSRLPPRHA